MSIPLFLEIMGAVITVCGFIFLLVRQLKTSADEMAAMKQQVAVLEAQVHNDITGRKGVMDIKLAVGGLQADVRGLTQRFNSLDQHLDEIAREVRQAKD